MTSTRRDHGPPRGVISGGKALYLEALSDYLSGEPDAAAVLALAPPPPVELTACAWCGEGALPGHPCGFCGCR